MPYDQYLECVAKAVFLEEEYWRKSADLGVMLLNGLLKAFAGK